MWGFSRLLVGSRGPIGRLSLSAAPARRHLGFCDLVGEDGMSQNALLRSVKGLGIPGTARKEDKKTKLKVASPAPEDDRQSSQNSGLPSQELPTDSFRTGSLAKDHFAMRNGVRCAGVHLIVDL